MPRFSRLLAEDLFLGLDQRLVEILTRSSLERYRDLLTSGKHKILERILLQIIAN